jgi:hypothetical protein
LAEAYVFPDLAFNAATIMLQLLAYPLKTGNQTIYFLNRLKRYLRDLRSELNPLLFAFSHSS